jgi:outer membrane protein OmpA-like peptidoglycan-associated protein
MIHFMHLKKRDEHEINSLKHNKDLVVQSHKSTIEQPKETDSKLLNVKENEIEVENDFIDGKPVNSLVIGNTNLSVTPIEVGMTYTINDILFASNSFDLNDKSKFIITQFSKFLDENKGMEIVIQGHTDNVGDAKKNELLSQQRADAVMKFLVQLGIQSSRMKSIGYGALHPKVPNTTDQNKAINRRTEFKIEKIQ